MIKKNLSKVGIEGKYFKTLKAIYNTHTTNIILDWQNLKAVPLKSAITQECLLLPLLFNVVLEILATAIRQKKKELKSCKLEKEN